MRKAAVTVLKILAFFCWLGSLVRRDRHSNRRSGDVAFFAELVPFVLMIVFSGVFLIIERGEVKIPFSQNAGKGTAVGLAAGAVLRSCFSFISAIKRE